MNTRYLGAADAEFQEAIDYYNEQRPGLGFEFSADVRDAIARIENYPSAWTRLSKRTRRCQVHRFPYSIIYEVRADSTSSSQSNTIVASPLTGASV